MTATEHDQLHVVTRRGTQVARVWCAAVGCGWASYRATVDARDAGRHLTVAELERGDCPRCLQASVRTYPPRHVEGEQPLPGMPDHRDDDLRTVDGRQLQVQHREERARRALQQA